VSSEPVHSVIRSARSDLVATSADQLVAAMAGDAARLGALAGADFGAQFTAPPLTADAFAWLHTYLAEHPEHAVWFMRWIVRRADRRVMGVVGLKGPPSDAGAVEVGYSLYPEFEGSGFATEATQAVIEWALTHPSVTRVLATIPPGHVRSIAVAERCGLRECGVSTDDEVGEVLVFERVAGE
jgi:RimJ/RimL family protein N-acetyltransferase